MALLEEAFVLLGGRRFDAIENSEWICNPVRAAILGMLLAAIVQSGSALITILVGMVAARIITVARAIPIMMGSEIGSALPNALTTMSHFGNRAYFRRAFAGNAMNDIMNFLTIIVLLPLEIVASPIEKISAFMVRPFSNITTEFHGLNDLTEYFLEKVIQIDYDTLEDIVTHELNMSSNDFSTIALRCVNLTTKEVYPFCPYEHLFAYSFWRDLEIGFVLFFTALIVMMLCLYGIVRIMQNLLAGRIAILLRKLMDKKLPYPFGWATNVVTVVSGALIVVVVQSSNVLTTILTPMVGKGIVTFSRYNLLCAGAAVGNTFVGIVAALSSAPGRHQEAIQMALCQAIFNILGIILFYPLPFVKRVPDELAMKLGNKTAKYRWFALVYIATVYFLVPAVILGLSFLSPVPRYLFIGSIFNFVFIIIGTSVLQEKFPKILPKFLKNWNFLPTWLHSLKPYDKYMTKFAFCLPFGKRIFEKTVEDTSVYETKIDPQIQMFFRLAVHTTV
ncbi:hypothetical protein FO519_004524 [Halicephalobus sp. NKZ332]|nr:hypothetical protein FO519_004524 [Halicephalobus sp. NKZ332]